MTDELSYMYFGGGDLLFSRRNGSYRCMPIMLKPQTQHELVTLNSKAKAKVTRSDTIYYYYLLPRVCIAANADSLCGLLLASTTA